MTQTTVKTVLSIAGSDCSGGAGIQADIKTITCHGLYAMTAVTALTAQNTTGVYGISEVEPEFLAKQLDCIFQDIRPDSIKIGMVASDALISVITEKLKQYEAQHIVLDPVMVSTSGSRLLEEAACARLIKGLFPLAEIIMPNIPEAEVLSGKYILTEDDAKQAAQAVANLCSGTVLLKGGHLASKADDLLYRNGTWRCYHGEKIENPNTHGTGCTLSSAIACRLAQGYSIEDAVELAKRYLTGAIGAGLDLGAGGGPLLHTYRIAPFLSQESS